MKKALLIIDVQKAVAKNAVLVEKIEKLQSEYEHVYISRFVNKGSALLDLMDWSGYDDESLAITPVCHAKVFDKNGYSSFLAEMTIFNEVHLCGYDTDACVYKTALDLMEHHIRPVILASLCSSGNETYHQQGLSLLERNIGKRNIVY